MDRLERIIADLERQRSAGRSPDREAILRAFPMYHEPLLAYFTRHEAEPTTVAHNGPESISLDFPTVPGHQVLRELGRGGQAVVYEARHLALDRRVALKMVLSGGTDSVEQERLFQEARTVARLHHPHIVAVHEVGKHAGCPYLSLEYLEGGSLASQVRDRPLPSPAVAARLVETLARAVHYAHECDVIHRDLKPANVLLDGSPGLPLDRYTPRLADFGLARPDSDGQSYVGGLCGTPTYMAPEQTRGRASRRSDIHGLGAILYFLLTGKPPFEGANTAEILRRVQDVPALPPRQLQPSVPADLEAICVMCLAKRPEDRYQTADALADDLRRFLDGEPVSARPLPLWQRVGRSARRKPAAAALVSVSLLGALFFVILTLTHNAHLQDALLKEEEQRQRAEANFERAETERDREARSFRRAREVVTLIGTIGGTELPEIAGTHEVRRKILNVVQKHYQDFIDERRDDPYLEEDLAVALSQRAGVLQQMGDHKQAIASLQQACALAEKAHDRDPESKAWKKRLAGLYHNLGSVLGREQRYDEARTVMQRSIDLRRPLVEADPKDVKLKADLAGTYCNLAADASIQGRKQDEIRYHRLALDLLEELYRTQRVRTPEVLNVYTKTLNNMILAYRADGNEEEARKLSGRVLEVSRDYDRRSSDPEARFQKAMALEHNGMLLLRDGKREEVRKLFAEVLSLRKELAEQNPDVVQFQYALAYSYRNHGALAAEDGQEKDALAWYAKAHAIHARHLAQDPKARLFRAGIVEVLELAGVIHGKNNRTDQARKTFDEARRHQEKLVEADPSDRDLAARLGRLILFLGETSLTLRQLEEAIGYLNRARSILEPLVTARADHADWLSQLGSTLNNLSMAHTLLKEHDTAERFGRQAVEYSRKAAQKEPRHSLYREFLPTSYLNHCVSLKDLQRFDDVAEVARACLAAPAANEDSTYRLGRLLGQCCAVVEKDRVETFAILAVQSLRRAVALGFKDAAALKTHRDFAAIRARPDFQQLIEETERKK